MNMWYFEGKKSFFDIIIKIENVRNCVLKVLTYVRTHPEELLVPKKWISIFGYEKFPGWVLTHIRTFRVSFQAFGDVLCGPKQHSWLFVLKNTVKSNFPDEEFFGMSSYTCKKFQLSMVYNFQFDHMCFKWLPAVLNSFFEFFQQKKSFFWIEYSATVEYSTMPKFFSRTNHVVTLLRFIFQTN